MSLLLQYYRKKNIKDTLVRVDQTGEIGAWKINAWKINAWQLVAFVGTKVCKEIEETAAQEKNHLEEFERLIEKRQVQATAIKPVWNVTGYALEIYMALISKKVGMKCTVTVEVVIEDHYNNQVRTLLDWEEELATCLHICC